MNDSALTLSLVEAARRIGVPERTLRKMALDGKFPARRIGVRWRVTERALSRWLEQFDRDCADNVVALRRQA